MTDWVQDRKREEAKAAARAARPARTHPKLGELREWVGADGAEDSFLLKCLERSDDDLEAAAAEYFRRTGSKPKPRPRKATPAVQQPHVAPCTAPAPPVYVQPAPVAYVQQPVYAPPPVYAQPAAAYTTMSVVVPPGYAGGMNLQVQTPDGRPMAVRIPDGLFAGHSFQFNVPLSAPPPVAVAAAPPVAYAAPQVVAAPPQVAMGQPVVGLPP
eukprot:CAMPEP_0119376398 /NCGR_PEP_ID=MMETSP1334-20130426/40054_1 /TAXON_ID=127549 /ORGANISM="Calcidiscus leptoporus, Strain RCC1130" /LENGTH=212 /DNA_ID=CAMNT_0007394957 /DNA_START=59 /DNA_END=697 /DNA_ORIENTATION=+